MANADRRRHGTSSHGDPARSWTDSGTTFVEVLISVVVLGIAGVAVLVGMSAALRGTTGHDRLATVQSNLSDAGDRLTDVTLGADTYVACATPGSYLSIVNPYDVSVSSVEFWNSSSQTWVGSCPASTALQKITLESSIGSMSRELAVVKRQASAAGSPGNTWNDGMVTPAPHPNLP